MRAKHAGARDIIKANAGAIGLPPFGLMTSGEKYRKTFVAHPVNGPLAVEAFQRVADGRTATSVAVWLTEQTGRKWRVKAVTDMIQRRTYLGERDGFTFTPLISEALWDQANAALQARSFAHKGGRRTMHGYSGLIYCECGAHMYRHQSTKNGKPVGDAKYRRGRGRRGDVTEQRCAFPALGVGEADKAVDALMADDPRPEYVTVTTGGDAGKRMELDRLSKAMTAAQAEQGHARGRQACPGVRRSRRTAV